MAFYSRAKVIIFFQLFEKSEKLFSILHSSPFTFFFFLLHISILNHTLASPKFLRSSRCSGASRNPPSWMYKKKCEHFFLHISKLNRNFAAERIKTIFRYAAN